MCTSKSHTTKRSNNENTFDTDEFVETAQRTRMKPKENVLPTAMIKQPLGGKKRKANEGAILPVPEIEASAQKEKKVKMSLNEFK